MKLSERIDNWRECLRCGYTQKVSKNYGNRDMKICKECEVSLGKYEQSLQNEVTQLEAENERLRVALRKVHKGPPASAIDFTKSRVVCAWVCDTMDMAADALAEEG